MVAHQAPLSIRFSSKEYWSGLSFSTPGDPNPGIKPVSFGSPELATLTRKIPRKVLKEKTQSPEISSEEPQDKVHFVTNCRTRNSRLS